CFRRRGIQCRLRCCESSNRYAEWRTTHVVQTDLVTEGDRLWIAAVFPANTNLKIRLDRASPFRSHSDQLSDAISIKHLERIVADNLSFGVIGQEPARVVASQAKRCFRWIVCAKREKGG